MKVTTLIPVHLNDGTPVPKEQLQGFVALFLSTFGGCTVEGTIEGHWVSESGECFSDTCLKLFVVTDSERLQEVEAIVSQIGRDLVQEAMYFEVDEMVQVRIINTK